MCGVVRCWIVPCWTQFWFHHHLSSFIKAYSSLMWSCSFFAPFCLFSFPDGLYKMDQFARIWKQKFSFLPLNSGVTKKEALLWCAVLSEQAGVVRQHPYKSRLPVLQKPLGEIFVMYVVMIVIIEWNWFSECNRAFSWGCGGSLLKEILCSKYCFLFPFRWFSLESTDFDYIQVTSTPQTQLNCSLCCTILFFLARVLCEFTNFKAIVILSRP